MYYSFLYFYVTFIKTQWNLTKLTNLSLKHTKHTKNIVLSDTNVYISENKLVGDLKISQNTYMYSSFLTGM